MAVAGVVCEGHSDFAILERDSLQRAQGSSGSSGVKEWCERNAGKLAAVIDPGVGRPLDLLVIALDADAAISAGIEDPPKHPSSYDASRLCTTIRGWMGKPLPAQLLITIPAMSIEAWIVAAMFKAPARPETIANAAHTLVEKGQLELDRRPKRQHKVVKPPHKYRAFADQVVGKWPRVKKACAEAARFERKVVAARARAKPSKK
jgi:hypothetical protein